MGRLFDDLVKKSKTELSEKEKADALAQRLAASRNADLERAYMDLVSEISAKLKKSVIHDSYIEKRFIGKKTIQRKHIISYYRFNVWLVDTTKTQICFDPNHKYWYNETIPTLFVDTDGKDFIWQKLKLFFQENQIHRVNEASVRTKDDPIDISDCWDNCAIKRNDILECVLPMIVLL